MKRVLTFVLSFGIFGFLHAQHVSLGPSVGFGHAWLDGLEKTTDVKFKPVFNVGVAVVYSTSEHFGIGADVKAFVGEGAKYDLSLIGSSAKPTVKDKATYLRVPVKAIYFFNDYGDRIRPKIFAGPSFGYLLGGKMKYNNAGYDIKDYWKSFDFGLTGGVGVNARIARATWLNLDLTYNHGLSNVSKAESNSKLSNRNLMFNAGVMLPLSTR